MADPVYLPSRVVEWSWDDVRRWGIVGRETGSPIVLEVELPPGWTVVPGHVRDCVWVLDAEGRHRAHAFLRCPESPRVPAGAFMWLIPRYDVRESPERAALIDGYPDGEVLFEAATVAEVTAWRAAHLPDWRNPAHWVAAEREEGRADG